MARSGATALVVVLVVMMALVQGSMAAKYEVGGSLGWQLNSLISDDPNFYQNWAHSNAPYYSTDFLEFRWIATNSVLQVGYAAFQACNTQGPIQAWLANPDGEVTTMVFPLKDYAVHTVYFISGDARNCASGQKFYIDVIA